MLSSDQHNEILDILRKKKRMSNQELCSYLHCSLSTLRRRLLSLEKNGLVKRIHGGVVLTYTANKEPGDTYRESENIEKKKYICHLTKDFIGNGMCVFIDSSSTALQLCTLLGDIHNLIVLTNGLKPALELGKTEHDSLKVFVTGGELKFNSNSLVEANFSEYILNSFRINLAICSCRGLDVNGVYEASLSQALIKQQVMKRADRVILLADDSKFSTNHFFRIGNLNEYEAIITNQKPDDIYLELAEKVDTEFLW